MCSEFKGAPKVGDKWTQNDADGKPITVEIKVLCEARVLAKGRRYRQQRDNEIRNSSSDLKMLPRF